MTGRHSGNTAAKKRAASREAPSKRPLKRRRKRFIDLGTLMYLALISITIMLLYRPIATMLTTKSRVPELKKEIVDLQKQNELLEEEVDSLKTDEGVELLAREDLGLVKPGEESFVVVVEEEGAALGEMEAEPDGEAKEDSIWQKIKNFLVSLSEAV
ncbi:MAG: septum formation initiator family protein [Actinomycetota bacterium]|nr:septum formation initiator family protein [Actinomycetota bacterium]